MSNVKLEIITPSDMFYSGDVEVLMAQTVDGDEGYLQNHGFITLHYISKQFQTNGMS